MDEEPHTVSIFPLFRFLTQGNISKFVLIFSYYLRKCHIHKLLIIIHPKNSTTLPIHYIKGFNHIKGH